MSALTLVLQQLPGVDADEFRNLRSYYACGKSYREALNGKRRTRSSPSTSSTKSSSGVSSPSDEDIDKPSATTTSKSLTSSRKSDSGVSSPSDEDIDKPSSTTTSKSLTSSSKSDSDDSSPSDEEVAESSTTTSEIHIDDEKEAPLKVKISKESDKPKETCTNNLRIMYRGRDILNLERNAQPYKWQLTSPLFGFYQKFSIYKNFSRHQNFESFEEYKMNACGICDFYEPVSDEQ
ncbi:hypothetical protein TSAR_007874 [Trichomalopsis sarcophagae]|uniref:Uncharacterized protein n=1 Tax=Trichomalopsis sarcophagae TaxID=543379 RepID=A0A232EQF2_9HYME|nr:hypothetical protein TSAR_007874 [Trichomalopsis sarcophagae]